MNRNDIFGYMGRISELKSRRDIIWMEQERHFNDKRREEKRNGSDEDPRRMRDMRCIYVLDRKRQIYSGVYKIYMA